MTAWPWPWLPCRHDEKRCYGLLRRLLLRSNRS
uniref:Uncharacterized protein n=1 Tax=Arundo donax TaxID=35708 RepID=A0A0A9EAG8_ARUDO